jgi:Spy/CpxP family protein refolding chaperone
MHWQGLVGSLTALLVGVTVASTGFAQPPFGGPPPGGGPGSFGGPPPGGGPDQFIEEHASRLGLDDETLEAIDQIVDESREKAQGLRAGLRGMHREMRDLLSQDTPDESAVMQQAEAIGQAETELHKHRLEALLQIRAMLTEEQRAELTRIRKETRTRWGRPQVEACEVDVDRFCPDAEAPWSRRGCVRDHWEELSPECQDGIEAARAKAHRGHRRGKHHGRGGMGEF